MKFLSRNDCDFYEFYTHNKKHGIKTCSYSFNFANVFEIAKFTKFNSYINNLVKILLDSVNMIKTEFIII